MKDNIKSFLLLILITVILGALLVLGMDVFGIITLPKEFSLRTLLNSDSEETVSLITENVISYPKDYYIENEEEADETEEEVPEKVDTTIALLPTNVGNDKTTESGIVYGANKYFYYNQLNTYGKTIYNEMYKNLDNLKSGDHIVEFGTVFNDLLNTSDGEKTLADAFQLSINALLLDHPEIFYLDVTKMYMYTEANKTVLETTYKISIGPEEGKNYLHEGFTSRSDVLVAENELNKLLDIITADFNGTTYQKIRQAHNYLIDNCVYDEGDILSHSHTAYGTLFTKISVCDGYAKAYKLLLDHMGIHCVQICGTATNSINVTENHTWNYVMIDDKWYAVDVTWDDPIIEGSGHLTDELRYANFMQGSDIFFKHHTEDGYIIPNGCFSYPTLNKTVYQ